MDTEEAILSLLIQSVSDNHSKGIMIHWLTHFIEGVWEIVITYAYKQSKELKNIYEKVREVCLWNNFINKNIIVSK